MPDITYPATFATVDGRTVTYTESVLCGECSGTLPDHIARNLACGPGYEHHNFRAWDTYDELAASTAAVGDVLPEDTAAAAALLGVGGRFRVTRTDGGGATREYEVMRLSGATTEEYPDYPANAMVRDIADSGNHAFPIVHQLYRGELVATRIGPENVERHNLFIAVALAGIGGVIQNGDNTRACRILQADSQESSGEVHVVIVDGDTNLPLQYRNFPEPTWRVLTRAESVPDVTEPTTVPPAPRGIIPRTLDDAEARIAALENLSQWIPANDDNSHLQMLASLRTVASWLDGGDRQRAGHDIAENHPRGDLCGAYEGLVCPTFGWSPRRSRGRWQTQMDQWTHNLTAFENQHSHLGAADILARWAEQYAAGGSLNYTANEYIETNLEEDKIRHVADLFAKIGWDAPDAPPEEQDYVVRVPVTRTVTYTETGYAEITVTARDEDSASEHVSENYYARDLVSMVDDWETDDSSHDTDDYSAEADFIMAEVVSRY